jgi:hypothetical protein
MKVLRISLAQENCLLRGENGEGGVFNLSWKSINFDTKVSSINKFLFKLN